MRAWLREKEGHLRRATNTPDESYLRSAVEAHRDAVEKKEEEIRLLRAKRVQVEDNLRERKAQRHRERAVSSALELSPPTNRTLNGTAMGSSLRQSQSSTPLRESYSSTSGAMDLFPAFSGSSRVSPRRTVSATSTSTVAEVLDVNESGLNPSRTSPPRKHFVSFGAYLPPSLRDESAGLSAEIAQVLEGKRVWLEYDKSAPLPSNVTHLQALLREAYETLDARTR